MNRRRWALHVGIFGVLSGCVSHTISGSYLARGQDLVEMIQITQSADGQLLGTLSHTGLKANGTLEQNSTNISGNADGQSITLVTKAPLPLVPSYNISGTISGGRITLTFPNGIEQFDKGDPAEYQSMVQQLTAQGAAIQKQQQAAAAEAERQKAAVDAQAALQRHIANTNTTVADLNKWLSEYASRVTGPEASKNQNALHATHEKALKMARHGWEIEQRYAKGSLQASQTYLAINQVALDLGTYDLQWEPAQEQGHRHIQEFDNAIAQSPCHQNDPAITNCEQQPAAIQAYQVARPVVLNRMDDIAAALKNDKAAMKSIVDQAQAYSIK